MTEKKVRGKKKRGGGGTLFEPRETKRRHDSIQKENKGKISLKKTPGGKDKRGKKK